MASKPSFPTNTSDPASCVKNNPPPSSNGPGYKK